MAEREHAERKGLGASEIWEGRKVRAGGEVRKAGTGSRRQPRCLSPSEKGSPEGRRSRALKV